MRTLTILLLVLVSFAIAETVTFQPNAAVGKDSLVRQHTPDTNYGADIGYYYGINQWPFHMTFIEFTELNDAQYQGATVNQATLGMHTTGVDGVGQYQVGACSTSWVEDTITWNNRPAGVFESFEVDYPENGYEWLFLDVTDYVQNWINGTWANNGFVFFDYYGSAQWVSGRSSDYTDDPTLRPKLILDYSDAAIEETTWGEIKASF